MNTTTRYNHYKFYNNYKRYTGFTLVELLIVMAILGLLTVLGIGNFQTARIKARDAKRKSDLASITKALEAYVNDHARYPSASADNRIICKPSGTPSTCAWGAEFSDSNGTIYAAELPAESSDNRTYRYESNSGVDFTLYASLENENDPGYSEYTGVDCGGTVCNYKVTSSNIN